MTTQTFSEGQEDRIRLIMREELTPMYTLLERHFQKIDYQFLDLSQRLEYVERQINHMVTIEVFQETMDVYLKAKQKAESSIAKLQLSSIHHDNEIHKIKHHLNLV